MYKYIRLSTLFPDLLLVVTENTLFKLLEINSPIDILISRSSSLLATMTITQPGVNLLGDPIRGSPFELGGEKSRAILNSIEIWLGDTGIQGFQVGWLGDRKPETVGSKKGSLETKFLKLNPVTQEKIVLFRVCKDGKKGHITGFNIQTNKSQSLVIGTAAAVIHGHIPSSLNIKSGFVHSISGTATDSLLYSIGISAYAISKSPVVEFRPSKIYNVRFHNFPPGPELIWPDWLESKTSLNDGPNETTWAVKGSQTRTITQEWKKSTTESNEASVTASSGFPGIGEVGAEAKFTMSNTVEHSTLEQEEKTVEWDYSGPQSPFSVMEISVYVRTARLELSYTYDVDGVLFWSGDGSEIPHTQKDMEGHYQGVHYNGTERYLKETPL